MDPSQPPSGSRDNRLSSVGGETQHAMTAAPSDDAPLVQGDQGEPRSRAMTATDTSPTTPPPPLGSAFAPALPSQTPPPLAQSTARVSRSPYPAGGSRGSWTHSPPPRRMVSQSPPPQQSPPPGTPPYMSHSARHAAAPRPLLPATHKPSPAPAGSPQFYSASAQNAQHFASPAAPHFPHNAGYAPYPMAYDLHAGVSASNAVIGPPPPYRQQQPYSAQSALLSSHQMPPNDYATTPHRGVAPPGYGAPVAPPQMGQTSQYVAQDHPPPATDCSLLQEICPGIRLKMACTLLSLAIFLWSCILWRLPDETFRRVFQRLCVIGVKIGPGCEVYRLFTAVFMQFSLKDLLICLLNGLQVSVQIEAKFGALRWLLLFFTSGTMGGLVGAATRPEGVFSTASAASLGVSGYQMGEILLITPQLMFSSRHYRVAATMAILVCLLQIALATFLVTMTNWILNLTGFCTGIFFGVTWNSQIQINKRLSLVLRVIASSGVLLAVSVCSTRLWWYGFPELHFGNPPVSPG